MNTIEKILLFGAAPAVLLLSLLEAVVLSRLEHYDWRAGRTFGASNGVRNDRRSWAP